MYTIVLLVEKALGPRDVTQVTTLHEGVDGQAFVVLVPADSRRHRLVEAIDDIALGRLREALRDLEPGQRGEAALEAVAAAQRAVDTTVTALGEAGVRATGEVTADDPLPAVVEAVRRHQADEVIVVTEPHLLEESVRADWTSRARGQLSVPVLRLLSHDG
jgi:hypothetical protein